MDSDDDDDLLPFEDFFASSSEEEDDDEEEELFRVFSDSFEDRLALLDRVGTAGRLERTHASTAQDAPASPRAPPPVAAQQQAELAGNECTTADLLTAVDAYTRGHDSALPPARLAAAAARLAAGVAHAAAASEAALLHTAVLHLLGALQQRLLHALPVSAAMAPTHTLEAELTSAKHLVQALGVLHEAGVLFPTSGLPKPDVDAEAEAVVGALLRLTPPAEAPLGRAARRHGVTAAHSGLTRAVLLLCEHYATGGLLTPRAAGRVAAGVLESLRWLPRAHLPPAFRVLEYLLAADDVARDGEVAHAVPHVLSVYSENTSFRIAFLAAARGRGTLCPAAATVSASTAKVKKRAFLAGTLARMASTAGQGGVLGLSQAGSSGASRRGPGAFSGNGAAVLYAYSRLLGSLLADGAWRGVLLSGDASRGVCGDVLGEALRAAAVAVKNAPGLTGSPAGALSLKAFQDVDEAPSPPASPSPRSRRSLGSASDSASLEPLQELRRGSVGAPADIASLRRRARPARAVVEATALAVQHDPDGGEAGIAAAALALRGGLTSLSVLISFPGVLGANAAGSACALARCILRASAPPEPQPPPLPFLACMDHMAARWRRDPSDIAAADAAAAAFSCVRAHPGGAVAACEAVPWGGAVLTSALPLLVARGGACAGEAVVATAGLGATVVLSARAPYGATGVASALKKTHHAAHRRCLVECLEGLAAEGGAAAAARLHQHPGVAAGVARAAAAAPCAAARVLSALFAAALLAPTADAASWRWDACGERTAVEAAEAGATELAQLLMELASSPAAAPLAWSLLGDLVIGAEAFRAAVAPGGAASGVVWGEVGQALDAREDPAVLAAVGYFLAAAGAGTAPLPPAMLRRALRHAAEHGVRQGVLSHGRAMLCAAQLPNEDCDGVLAALAACAELLIKGTPPADPAVLASLGDHADTSDVVRAVAEHARAAAAAEHLHLGRPLSSLAPPMLQPGGALAAVERQMDAVDKEQAPRQAMVQTDAARQRAGAQITRALHRGTQEELAAVRAQVEKLRAETTAAQSDAAAAAASVARLEGELSEQHQRHNAERVCLAGALAAAEESAGAEVEALRGQLSAEKELYEADRVGLQQQVVAAAAAAAGEAEGEGVAALTAEVERLREMVIVQQQQQGAQRARYTEELVFAQQSVAADADSDVPAPAADKVERLRELPMVQQQLLQHEAARARHAEELAFAQHSGGIEAAGDTEGEGLSALTDELQRLREMLIAQEQQHEAERARVGQELALARGGKGGCADGSERAQVHDEATQTDTQLAAQEQQHEADHICIEHLTPTGEAGAVGGGRTAPGQLPSPPVAEHGTTMADDAESLSLCAVMLEQMDGAPADGPPSGPAPVSAEVHEAQESELRRLHEALAAAELRNEVLLMMLDGEGADPAQAECAATDGKPPRSAVPAVPATTKAEVEASPARTRGWRRVATPPPGGAELDRMVADALEWNGARAALVTPPGRHALGGGANRGAWDVTPPGAATATSPARRGASKVRRRKDKGTSRRPVSSMLVYGVLYERTHADVSAVSSAPQRTPMPTPIPSRDVPLVRGQLGRLREAHHACGGSAADWATWHRAAFATYRDDPSGLAAHVAADLARVEAFRSRAATPQGAVASTPPKAAGRVQHALRVAALVSS